MKLTRKQLIRRMQIIQEDLDNLYATLKEQGVQTHIENKFGSSVDTYATNIQICLEITRKGKVRDFDGHRVETEWTSPSERKIN